MLLSPAIWVIAVAAAGVVWATWTQAIGAGWEPTPKRVVRRMLELARPSEGGVLYDLGSGDGRIVIEAAKRYGVRAVGIEADPLRVLWSRLVVRMHNLGRLVTIVRGNFFDQSLTDAGAVTLFLTQGTNQRLKPKLLGLKEGTRVVSYVWTFEGWIPTASDEKLEIHMYQIGPSVQERPAKTGIDVKAPAPKVLAV